MSELLTSCALPHPLTDALPSSALFLTQVMDQLPYRVLLKDTRFSYIAGGGSRPLPRGTGGQE